MAIDFTKPITTDGYSALLQFIRDNSTALCQMLNETLTITGVPTNAVRWNITNSRFELWNGTSWVILTARLMMDIDTLDSQQGSFYQNASNLNTGILPAARFDDTAHGNRTGGALHALVTTIANGFMSASDKVKLNGMEAGSTADQTASEILALLLTVDGGASGLDAQFLAGQALSYFAPISSPNFSGTPLINSNKITYKYGFVTVLIPSNTSITNPADVDQTSISTLVERQDISNIFNLATGEYIPSIAGWYEVNVNITLFNMVNAYATVYPVVGGVNASSTYGHINGSYCSATSEVSNCNGTLMIHLNASQPLKLIIESVGSTSRNVLVNSVVTFNLAFQD